MLLLMWNYILLLICITILIDGVIGTLQNHDQMCVAAQGIGRWNDAKFVSTIFSKYVDFPAVYNAERKDKKPRVLFIGDSINRNAVFSICEACNSYVNNVYNCTAPMGGGFHYSCHTNMFEIASFFIFGASLDAMNLESSYKRKDHSCGLEEGLMPFGTLIRVQNYTQAIKKSFSGEVDLIVLNAMFWDIVDLQSDGKSKTFETTDFNKLATEYTRNITTIINAIKLVFPNSQIVLQKNVPPQANLFYLLGKKTVNIMNTLIDIAAIKNNVCVLNLDNLVREYSGLIFAADGMHPNANINVNYVNLLLNIALNL